MSRPNSFSVGRMRYRVSVQKHVDTIDDAGQPVSSWVNLYANEPAEYETTSGGQRFRGSQVAEGIDAIFTMRYRDEFDCTQQIVFRGQTYGVVFVKPVDGRDRYVFIYAKAVTA